MPAVYGPPHDEAEFARRRPMWVALSDLYLDTMVMDSTVAYICRTAREQGFDAWDLRQMLLYEVGPAVSWNLYLVAGEWALFDENWLARKIEKNWRRPLHRWRCRLKSRLMLGPIEQDLERVFRELTRGA